VNKELLKKEFVFFWFKSLQSELGQASLIDLDGGRGTKSSSLDQSNTAKLSRTIMVGSVSDLISPVSFFVNANVDGSFLYQRLFNADVDRRASIILSNAYLLTHFYFMPFQIYMMTSLTLFELILLAL
jgi:hypothetical protein